MYEFEVEGISCFLHYRNWISIRYAYLWLMASSLQTVNGSTLEALLWLTSSAQVVLRVLQQGHFPNRFSTKQVQWLFRFLKLTAQKIFCRFVRGQSSSRGQQYGEKFAKIRLLKLCTTTDLGVCACISGIQQERSNDYIFLSEKAYTERIINRAKMASTKSAKTLLSLAHPLYEKRISVPQPERQEMDAIPFW